MNSHLYVILLCLSGIYCISSTFDNLKWEELKRILNGQTVIKEWGVTLDQYILQENDDGSKTPFHVGTTVEEFAKKMKADQSALEKFGSIRDTIKTAYQCTLAKYTSFANFLIVQDILMIRKVTNDAVGYVSHNEINRISGGAPANELFRTVFVEYSKGSYNLDFDVNIEADQFNILTKHGYDTKKKKVIQKILSDLIKKELGVNIRHKTYSNVMKAKLANQYNQDHVETLNKLICVLNESIMLLDNFIVDKCVKHEGNFVKSFKSLQHGVTGDLMWLLQSYNKQKATGDVVPGTQPIRASGCFVENIEIKVAGLEWNLPNKDNPTNYGQTAYRQTETNYKIIRTTNPSPGRRNVGMVLFRDAEIWPIDHSQPSSSRV